MRKIIKSSAFLLLLFFAGTASAYVTPEIAKNDMSIQFLHQIFGDVGGLFSGWNTSLSGTNILGLMFEQFNYGVAVLAIFIFAYIFGKGILDTAAEGQFLGKKANSLWIPIRAILGLILLVPTSAGGGYNVVQIFAMWIVMQGVALADSVWSVAVVAMKDNRAASYSTADEITRETSLQDYQGVVQSIFQNLVCTYTVEAVYTTPTLADGSVNPKFNANYYVVSATPFQLSATNAPASGMDFQAQIFDNSTGKLAKMSPNPVKCGSLVWNDLKLPIFKNNAIKTITFSTLTVNATAAEGGKFIDIFSSLLDHLVIDEIEPLAKAYVDNAVKSGGGIDKAIYAKVADVEDGIWDGPNVALGNPMQDLSQYYLDKMGVGNGGYVAYLQNVYSNYYNTTQQTADMSSTDVTKFIDEGWIMAGAYYTRMKATSSTNPSNTSDSPSPQSNVTIDMPTAPKASLGSVYSDPIKNAGEYATSMAGSSDRTGSETVPGSDSASNPALNTDGSRSSLQKMVVTTGGVAAGLSIGLGLTVAYAGAGGAATAPMAVTTAAVIIAGVSVMTAILQSPDTDPIYLLSVLGAILLASAAVAYAVMLGVMWGLGVSSSFGQCLSGFANGYNSTTQMTSMAAVLMLAGMVAFGGLLQVYLPMLYFIYFLIAAIFWFVVVVELMVVVVVGVLGLMMPEGQHDVWGMAQQAVFMILNAYLRPVMMVIGLIAASFVSVVAMKLLTAGFYDAMMGASMNGASLANPLTALLFLVFYITTAITAVTLPLKLITSVPDVCMKGFNYAAQESGRMEQSIGEIKGGFTKAAGAMGAGLAAGARQAGGKGSEQKGDANTENKDDPAA